MIRFAAFSGWCLTSKLTGPEQRGGICASVFAGTNAGTLCRVRLSDLLGITGDNAKPLGENMTTAVEPIYFSESVITGAEVYCNMLI